MFCFLLLRYDPILTFFLTVQRHELFLSKIMQNFPCSCRKYLLKNNVLRSTVALKKSYLQSSTVVLYLHIYGQTCNAVIALIGEGLALVQQATAKVRS